MGHTADYRMWVLSHWRGHGWSSLVDRIDTKKGHAAIQWLVKSGMLEVSEFGLYRATEEGHSTILRGAFPPVDPKEGR